MKPRPKLLFGLIVVFGSLLPISPGWALQPRDSNAFDAPTVDRVVGTSGSGRHGIRKFELAEQNAYLWTPHQESIGAPDGDAHTTGSGGPSATVTTAVAVLASPPPTIASAALRDLRIMPTASAVISGYVTDATTGWPLYASVEVTGTVVSTVWNDPLTGFYQVTLPEDNTYTFTVKAWVPGYLAGGRELFVSGNATEDFALDADRTACVAPGYTKLTTDVFYDGFESGSLGPTWSVITTAQGRVRVASTYPYSGTYGALLDAAVDGVDSLAALVLSQDLSGVSNPALDFWWREFGDEDHAEDGVFISDDNGATWCQVLSFNGGPSVYRNDIIDLTGGAAACGLTLNANFQINFQFFDNFTIPADGYAIDEVRVTESICVLNPGGLVVGHVNDDNTGLALDGATVESEDGYTATTWPTPADPAVDDGFYTIFSPQGTKTFTATLSGYGPDVRAVTVVQSDTVRQDFALPAGRLQVTPTALSSAVELGMTGLDTVTLSNTGAHSLSFRFVEQDRGFQPTLLLPAASGAAPARTQAPALTTAADCALYKDYAGAEPEGFAEFCSRHAASPSSGSSPVGATDVGYAQDIGFVSDNFVTFMLNDFPGQTVVGTNADVFYGMDFDPGATTLWALNDTTGELGVIDLATGAFTGIVSAPAPVDFWTGLTIDPSTGTFYASDASDLFTIDPASGAATWIGAFGTSVMVDIAMNAAGEMYGHDIGTDAIYAIDPATGAATFIGPTGYDASFAQGMDFDNADGTLYIFLYIGGGANVYGSVDLTTGAVTALATDDPRGEFEGATQTTGSADWLTATPISGTLGALGFQNVRIDLNAAAPSITQPGEYYATLKVNNDTPYVAPRIPVTMSVTAPPDWGKLEGTVASLGYCDANPAPITDVEVLVETWMTETITFTAPVEILFADFESAFPPTGWTVTNNGGDCVWVGDDPGGRGNLTGGSGGFAIADSDDCGSGTAMNTHLYSPIVDVSSLQRVLFEFKYDYNNFEAGEAAAVDVSANGGGSWTNLVSWNSDRRGPASFSRDVTPELGGSTQAQIRFRYAAPGWDWWWQVDDVFLGDTVTQTADVPISWTLTGDANGRYSRWFDQAYSPLTLTVAPPEHEGGQAFPVNVSGGTTTTQDFDLRWLQPCVGVTPGSLSAVLDLGASVTLSLEVNNAGAVSTSFRLDEVDRGFQPVGSVQVSGPRPETVASAPSSIERGGAAYGPASVFRITAQPAAVSAARASPAAPTAREADVSLLLDDGGAESDIGVNNTVDGFQFIWLNRFTPAPTEFPFQLEQISVVFGSAGVNVGDAVDLIVYEDTDGDGDPGNAAWLSTLNAVVLANDGVTWNEYTLPSPVTLYGPGDVLIGVINRYQPGTGGGLLDSPAALDTTASQGRSWIGWWSVEPAPAPPLLPPDASWSLIDAFLPGNWLVRGFGRTGTGDVPWLSEVPVSGTLAADTGLVAIDVTLDAAGVTQPGEYYATLNVKSNDPVQSPYGVPVTMTINTPASYGKLEGLVEGLGHCDSSPAPLKAADVWVESGSGLSWTLSSDVNGAYTLWLDEAHSPLSVKAAAGDHVSATVSGIVITRAQTTVVDIALRETIPCGAVSPTGLDVTVALGVTHTEKFTISNLGAGYVPGGMMFSISGITGTLAALVEQKSTANAPLQTSVIDQQPNRINGFLSDAGCDLCPGVQVLAENFNLATQETIHTIVLWSGYAPLDGPIDPDVLTVIFHDDAGGIPGATIATETNVPYTRQQTGVMVLGVHEWMHTLRLANPVTLGPGSYWVEIYNDTRFGTDDFFWETGDADSVGNGRPGSAWATSAPGSAWTFDGVTQLAFQLWSGLAGGPVDVPWLSNDPITGTVSVDGSTAVDVSFHAFPDLTLQPGYPVFTATLVIDTDDPVSPTLRLPVTMTVTIDPPHASFASNSPIYLGEAAQFINTTTGVPPASAWFWDLGAGAAPATSTFETPPPVTYATAGEREVSLTATNAAGSDTFSDTFTVCSAPLSGAAYVHTEPIVGQPVTFTAVLTPADVIPTPLVRWSFGATGTQATTVFTQPVEQRVTLTATNACDQVVYSDPVPPIPAVYVEKTVDPLYQQPGYPATYTIVFGNLGDADFLGVTISDALPSEVNYAWSVPAGSHNAATRQLAWHDLKVAAGSRFTHTLGVTIDAAVLPNKWITNSVTLFWDGDPILARVSHRAQPPPGLTNFLPILLKNR